MEPVLEILAQNGPLAVIGGAIVLVLWKKLTALQVHYEGDPTDATKVGLIARMRHDAQEREDKLRADYGLEIKTERDENKQLWRETNDAFKGLLNDGE